MSAGIWTGAAASAAPTLGLFLEDGAGALSALALGSLPASPFTAFATAVSAHARAALAGRETMGVDLVFARVSLLHHDVGPTRPQALPVAIFRSPWLQASPSRARGERLRARAVWSEGQLLLDQALLAQPQATPKPPRPLDDATFDHLAQAYADTVVLAPTSDARGRARRALAETTPPGLLWLFEHAWQSTLMPFANEARDALSVAMARGVPGYAALVAQLLDAWLAEPARPRRLRTIRDLGPLGLPAAYRLHDLH